MASLTDKVIVLIGGTTGLGLSAAQAFVDAGARVVVVGRNPDSATDAVKQLGSAARSLTGDAADSSVAPQAIAMAVRAFGRFDGLYHVAGGSGRKRGDGPLHDLTDEGWAFTMHLNLDSIFYSNRAAARQFLSQKTGGSVLNIGSVLGSSPSPKFFTTHAYAAAKSGVIGFTRSLASYYAPHNIRFNVLAPALVETPMSLRAVGDEAIKTFIKTKQPLDGGRVGEPADLDAAAVYFMSDGSKFATGQILTVDGGWSVAEGQYD